MIRFPEEADMPILGTGINGTEILPLVFWDLSEYAKYVSFALLPHQTDTKPKSKILGYYVRRTLVSDVRH